MENRTLNPEISLSKKGDAYCLNITIDESFASVKTQMINTDRIGYAFQSETPYENPDGSPVTINQDYFGKSRNAEVPMVGTLQNLKVGINKIKVWGN